MANKESKAMNRKDKKEKKSKDKKSFFKSFKAELKKVSWPTPKQLVNNTTAVIVIVLILAAIVFVLDLAFEAANKYGVDKVKESIVTSSQEENGDVTSESTEENGATEESAQPAEEDVEATDANQVTEAQ